MIAFQQLSDFVKQTSAVASVAGRLGWDQQTMMPKGAGHMRAEEFAAMELVLHGRRTDPRIGDWLSKVDRSALGADDLAVVENIEWSYFREKKRPAKLMEAIARAGAKGFEVWSRAKENEAVQDFLPTLKELVALRQEEAAALDAQNPYDGLLQDYERGMTTERLVSMFETMRPRLVALAGQISEKPMPLTLSGVFAHTAQLDTAKAIAQQFGYDYSRGRIDLAVHPFCSGAGDDVRITTRVDEADPLNCLYSTLHEVGHASYEQHIDPSLLFTPLSGGVSLGVHESQSRLYENQLGRSRGMSDWICDQLGRAMNGQGPDHDAFYRAVNKVQKGFIRTESDEVHYNLHVALRFDLERALLSGDLQVEDLEAAWNDRVQEDFGLSVEKPSLGVLQDVHWSDGTFAYFPTYSLGNLYAGCLFAQMQKDLPDLNQALQEGDPSAAVDWLRTHIHQHGSRFPAQQLIESAAQQPATAEPLLQYLEEKYSEIYDL